MLSATAGWHALKRAWAAQGKIKCPLAIFAKLVRVGDFLIDHYQDFVSFYKRH
jgi:hypothetical protein